MGFQKEATCFAVLAFMMCGVAVIDTKAQADAEPVQNATTKIQQNETFVQSPNNDASGSRVKSTNQIRPNGKGTTATPLKETGIKQLMRSWSPFSNALWAPI